MKEWQSLAHTKWEGPCKYHVVIVPKYRKKVLYGKLRKRIGEILRELCRYKNIEILDAHAMLDHIHMCISVPPKYSIAMLVVFDLGQYVSLIFSCVSRRETAGHPNVSNLMGYTCVHFEPAISSLRKSLL